MAIPDTSSGLGFVLRFHSCRFQSLGFNRVIIHNSGFRVQTLGALDLSFRFFRV